MKQIASHLRTKSGNYLHPVGIGTWGYGEYPLFSPGTESEVGAIKYTISLGQNHIDTAEMYANGGAEQVVGQAIKLANRSDLFIASKLWKNHVAKGQVQPAVDAMLRRLGSDYLDLLYIHAPWFDAPWQEAIPQIGELINEGVVRYFGISNFNADRLQEALNITRHPIAANQIHYNFAHQQEVTPELRELCAKNNIAIVAHMPLEKGEALNDPLINGIAQKYEASPAQIALAWLVYKGVYPIPKASNKNHIDQNCSSLDIMLKSHELAAIDKNRRIK